MSGILVLQISLDHFLEQLSTVKVGGEGFVYLVDQTGHAVAHPKYLPQGEIIDLTPIESVQRVKNGESGVKLIYNPMEREWGLNAYEPSHKYGWGVVVQEPYESAYELKNTTLRMFLLLNAAIFSFFLLVADGVVRAVRALDKESNNFHP